MTKSRQTKVLFKKSLPASDVTGSDAIRQALRQCIDPELGIDIISLGLVYSIHLKPPDVTVNMTLTTPGCPLGPYFIQRVSECVAQVNPKLRTSVKFSFDPPWDPSKMAADARTMLGR